MIEINKNQNNPMPTNQILLIIQIHKKHIKKQIDKINDHQQQSIYSSLLQSINSW